MITKDPRFLQKFDYIIVMKNQVKRKKKNILTDTYMKSYGL